MFFFLFLFSLVLKGTSLSLPDDSKPCCGPSLQSGPAAASPSTRLPRRVPALSLVVPRRGPGSRLGLGSVPQPSGPGPAPVA